MLESLEDIMQEKIQIITDGSCDLGKELTEEKNITVVPFYVSFDSETYFKEIEELNVREFYKKMVDYPDVFPKTSMPSVDDYYQVFLPLAKEGIPAICICITAKFSGSLQSATTARDMILEEYPDAKITVIDSTVNTVLQGMFVLEACKARDMGWEYEKIVERLLEIRESGRIFFTIGNIDYLKHGGRIGKLAGLAGGVLKIKPLITLMEGEIQNSGITRNWEKSLKKVIEMLEQYLKERKVTKEEYSICIGYGYDYEEAEHFRDMGLEMLREKIGLEEIPIFQIGATIGVHTGPYPIGFGIIKKIDCV